MNYGQLGDQLAALNGAHERTKFRSRAVDFLVPIAIGVAVAWAADRWLDWPRRDAIMAGFAGAVLQSIIVEATKRQLTPQPPGAGHVAG